MAQVSGTTDSYDLVGVAEDVEDAIFSISPEETPFLTMAKKKTASNTLHQWQTDALASAAANRQIEGDDASFTTASPGGLLLHKNSTLVGITDFGDTNGLANTYIDSGTVTAATSGIAVNPT